MMSNTYKAIPTLSSARGSTSHVNEPTCPARTELERGLEETGPSQPQLPSSWLECFYSLEHWAFRHSDWVLCLGFHAVLGL